MWYRVTYLSPEWWSYNIGPGGIGCSHEETISSGWITEESAIEQYGQKLWPWMKRGQMPGFEVTGRFNKPPHSLLDDIREQQ